ncbi:hypothetical protein BGZ63DRAFT_415155 [Mariannaea sp. PMI_226]|nr:hypothetical protein BGZ63DRAFT_415155 [Mariannaea sp. PMI_226]
MDEPAHPTDRSSWLYPPEFQDGFSAIPLVSDAIKDLQRRVDSPPRSPSPPNELTRHLVPIHVEKLTQLAGLGGPNLHDLRGYPPINNNYQPSRAVGSTSPTPEDRPLTSSGHRMTTPYDPSFDRKLTDSNVRTIVASEMPDLQDFRAALTIRRQSLSPSNFSSDEFKVFQDDNDECKTGVNVQRHIIPTILGSTRDDELDECTRFENLVQLTDIPLAAPMPDIYYGSRPEDLEKSILSELSDHIIPSNSQDMPVAPNFFMQVKGPLENIAVAKRQARHDSALGSRAMHSLQNYQSNEPLYDGKPYTFSSIYYGGTLLLYAHHVTAPRTPKGMPEYHTTEVGGWYLCRDVEEFCRGISAFRNIRDLAKQYRDGFVLAANTRFHSAQPQAFQTIT